jgi:ribonuclease T1
VNWRHYAAAAAVALATLAAPVTAQRAPLAPSPQVRIDEVRVADLPREARAKLALIRQGGPFPYAKDGAVFANRERILPPQPRGYYREYTVKTPGERTRGGRRIVVGRGGDLYYTDDHYAHFRRIRE